MTTGQVAKEFGVHPRTVNRWKALGKIKPSHQTLGGEDRYDPYTVRMLKKMTRS